MSRRASLRSPLAGAAVAAVATSVTWRATRRLPERQALTWQRRNFRDREVTLLLGPAVAAGALCGAAVSGPRGRSLLLVVAGSAAAVGAYDDLRGDQHARGLAGHARALRNGRVTTGMVKLVTLAGCAAASSRRRHQAPTDVAIGTALVAGTANLVNLFDLRPGRAVKVSLLAATALAVSDAGSRPTAAVVAGVAAAAFGPDVGERGMLGDCGAGTLGLVLGWSADSARSRPRRLAAMLLVVAATLLSERVSFSAVIERTRVLRALDELGRRRA